MADTKEGILQQLPSGRWAVFRPGRAPVEITAASCQPRPLLKLIALVPALYLLLDWLMNDTTNIVSVWLKQRLE